MDFCRGQKYLRILPKPEKRIVWSWQTPNGTVFHIVDNQSADDDCHVELACLAAVSIAFLITSIAILKYRCSSSGKYVSGLLPFHTPRTLLCIALLLTLVVEFSESLLTSISVSTILTIFATVSSWILHRETEIRTSLGTALSAGVFAVICLSRIWKFSHLYSYAAIGVFLYFLILHYVVEQVKRDISRNYKYCLYYIFRYGLSIEHVRITTTGIVALVCGVLSLLDSCTLYRMMRRSKRYTIRHPENARISYVHASTTFLSRITFHWVTRLLSRGCTSPLEPQDLGVLPEKEATRYQHKQLKRIWEKQRSKNGKLSLWRSFWSKIWFPFAVGGLLKFLGDVTTLVGPLTISKIVDYVSVAQNGTNSEHIFRNTLKFSELMENGYFLGLVVFIAALLQSTLSQASTHILCVEGIRLRTALQGLLYDKALRLCSWSIVEDEKPPDKEKDQNRYQQLADIGTLTNLISEDAYNVMSFFWIGHYTWAIPLKISAIIFLLYMKLGISAIIGVLCCISIVTPMQLILGKKMSKNSKSISERSDARLRLVNEILQGMKLVKLRAWEGISEERIKRTRDEELRMLDKDAIYWALINFLTHASSVLTTLFTFGVYFWLEEKNLDVGNVFASLALFSQLTVPLCIFPVIIPIIINAMISTKRMEEFLQLPEIANVLPEVVEQKVEVHENRPINTNSIAESIVSKVDVIKVNNTATFGSLDNINEDEEDQQSCCLRDYKLEIASSVDSVFEKDPETPILKLNSCVFSWGTDDNRLEIENLTFPRGQLTLIVGKTGSGKSSLLLAILGEIHRMSGTLEWTKGSRIAYVAQKPWLQNATLRENILFGSSFRPRRYRNVLRACSLQPDVEILPGHDLTRIGEKGINLSGGQKQRVTIARAIYSDADIIIMDDPLSALDQQVGQQIFDHGIRKLLLRSGRTVIMVTHRLDLLSTAHQVIVMDGCRVRAVGTKTSIEESDPELAAEWKKALTRQNDESRIHKTAKDRWSLIRLVSRIGINVRNKHASDGSWITDQDAHVNPPVFVPLRMRRTTLSGSRYLSHDLTDLPVPTEEWKVVKKRAKSHQNAVRSSSLQPQRRPPPVLRQSSTPTILESRYTIPRKRNNTFDSGQSGSVLRQIFSGRIVNTHPDELILNREKGVLRRLMPSNSNKQMQYNLKSSSQNHERDHYPIKRLLSIDSKGTDETDDIEERVEDLQEQVDPIYEDRSSIVTKMICLDYTKAGGWLPGLMYIAAAIVCQIIRVYTDLWLSRWTDRDSQITRELDTVFYFEVYMSLSVSSILLSFVYNAAGQWAGARARRKLHQEAISGLLKVPISFFDCNPVGKILNCFSADVGVIDKKLSTSIQRLTSFALLCGSAMIVNVIISPWFLIAAVPTCCIYYLVQRFYRRSARHLQRLDGSTRGPVATHFSETLCGLASIRASKLEARFMETIMKCIDSNTNAFLILNTSTRWLGIALDYLGAAIVVTSIFAVLMSADLYPDRVTPALVGLAINYTLLVPIYLNWVVKFTAEIEMYMGSVARISAYRHAPVEDYRENGFRVPDSWPKFGEVVFENVSLRYDLQTDPVISNLNLKIPAGQKLGICGRTGSGKSSTVMALFHLINIDEGRILLDGVDIQEVPLSLLRSRVSAIPQDVIMFSGTIRENLDPLSEHEDEELWKALELAQIKDIVSSHPEGLYYEVREGGENFSAGQLQLLCMARAVLRKSPIVVFDEATSALDTTTEKSLLKDISNAFREKTVITIAHRAAALLDCDRVIVFDEGKIVEEGSPHDLLANEAGYFSKMLKLVEQTNTKSERKSQK